VSNQTAALHAELLNAGEILKAIGLSTTDRLFEFDAEPYYLYQVQFPSVCHSATKWRNLLLF